MIDLDDQAGQRVRSPRRTFQPAIMRLRAETVSIHLLELSERGAHIHAAVAPAVGTRVRIGCGADLRSAIVIWAEKRRFGVRFAEPLPDGAVDALLARRQAEVAIASARIGALER